MPDTNDPTGEMVRISVVGGLISALGYPPLRTVMAVSHWRRRSGRIAPLRGSTPVWKTIVFAEERELEVVIS